MDLTPRVTRPVPGASVFLALALLLAPAAAPAQQQGPPDELDVRYPATIPLTSKIRIGGGARLRVEQRDGLGLFWLPEDDDTVGLSRLRFDLRWKLGRKAEAILEVQDTRAFWEETTVPGEEAETELQSAFVRWLSPPPSPGAADIRFSLGRQELATGSERFLGPEEWTNVGRSWDAAVVEYRKIRMGWKAFVADPGSEGLAPDEVTLAGWTGDWLLPWNAALPGIAPAPRPPARVQTLEPQVYYRHDSRDIYPGNRSLEEWTVAVRSSGPLPRLWTYDAEGGYQLGSHGTGNVSAWGLRASFQRSFGNPRSPVLVTLDASWASGDDDPADEDRGQFDPLYPTFHNRLGEADLVGWSNLRHLGARVAYERGRIGTFAASFHWFQLDDPGDAWRNARGETVRPGAPWASRDLGTELDFVYTWTWNDYIDFRAGIARFTAGDFVQETGPDDDFRSITFQGKLRF